MSEMLRSYLVAWLAVLGLSLGALANLMVHTLTGGRWGEPLRPPLVAAARLLPLVAALYLPLLFGYRHLYPWAADPAAAEHAPWWLNAPFFLVRSIGYLGIWSLLAHLWLRADRRGAAQGISAAGLIAYTFTVSLAAYDWIVSLAREWYSSGFGLVVGVEQMLAGAAFGVAAAALSVRGRAVDEALRLRFHDLGNVLLMYVLTWAYLAFTQFLIIWAENLPREISWYVPRLQTSWYWLGAALVAFNFFLPLLILLSRAAKRSPLFLGGLAAALLVVHAADVLWMAAPSFRPEGFSLRWTDLAAFAGVAAVWGSGWRRAFRNPPARAAKEDRAYG
jgi:hypothetical protein